MRWPGARGRVAMAVAVSALACGDISAPTRNDLYEWRLIVPTASGEDTVNFHWGRDDLPVRIWVSGDEIPELPALTQRAIDTWEAGFLYGEFAAQLVSDSSAAQVIVRGVPPPASSSRVTRLPSALAPECGGATDVDISPDLAQLTLPIRIFINPRTAGDLPALADCLALTSIHEMGHALGILAHSPEASDIMFSDPRVDLPSGFDRETAELLYHLPANIETVGP